MTVDLAAFHVDGLQQLAGLIPHESPEELLKIVISRGLVAMLTSEFRHYRPSAQEIAGNMNESQSVSASVLSSRPPMRNALAFPSRMNMMVGLMGKEDWAELHARDAEYDRETARMERDLGLTDDGDVHAMPHRHVEKTLSVQVPVELRQPLANFLDAHPEMSEAEALTTLLQRALGQEESVETRPETENQRKATAMLDLAKRLYLRAGRHCLG